MVHLHLWVQVRTGPRGRTSGDALVVRHVGIDGFLDELLTPSSILVAVVEEIEAESAHRLFTRFFDIFGGADGVRLGELLAGGGEEEVTALE